MPEIEMEFYSDNTGWQPLYGHACFTEASARQYIKELGETHFRIKGDNVSDPPKRVNEMDRLTETYNASDEAGKARMAEGIGAVLRALRDGKQ